MYIYIYIYIYTHLFITCILTYASILHIDPYLSLNGLVRLLPVTFRPAAIFGVGSQLLSGASLLRVALRNNAADELRMQAMHSGRCSIAPNSQRERC